MIPLSVVLVRLGLALAFGAVIGVEREWRAKNAGLKTMALVAWGAAAFAMMSDTFGPDNHNPGQIAAAVVGGIGFIGAGVIMHRGLTVQGVTTAATLWAVASVGVAAGLGQYPLATVLTIGIVIVQFVMRYFEHTVMRVRQRSASHRFELCVDCDSNTLPRVSEQLEQHPELKTLRRSILHGPDYVSFRVEMRTPGNVGLAGVEALVASLAGVVRVEVRDLGIEEET